MKKNKKRQERKAFTLVELLAVIVILAVILIIAIPQIMETIKETRLKSIESSARLIATNAEKDYFAQQAVNQNYNATSIPCTDVAKLNDDYSSCIITYDGNGIASVELKGTDGGKFDGITCTGTKDNIRCKQALPGYMDAVEKLMGLCTGTCLKSGNNDGTANSDGLLQDKHGDYRYQGSDPKNYATFNGEEAGWKIVGLFNVDGEQRVKLVKVDAIGKYSWDSSAEGINNGNGVNEWSQADLKKLLNEYYYDGVTNGVCYVNSKNTSEACSFSAMSSKSKKLIADATWYLGGANYQDTLDNQYTKERGTTVVIPGTTCSGNLCNDTVTRTTSWVGKVGLIYPSDFAYASANAACKNKISTGCGNNWLASTGWTITSYPTAASATFYAGGSSTSGMSTYAKSNVKPSVYLISGIQMKGSGTTADPYVFAE